MDDPHIHVESGLGAGAATRNVVASAFGLAGDLPGTVTTGCGERVPRAMASSRPDRVTCLACREHARRQHLSHAEQVEQLIGIPGMDISDTDAREAAKHHRDLAERFSDPRT